MGTFIFYTAAVALCGVSTILIHSSTSYAVPLKVNTALKPKLRLAGRVLIAIAAVSAGMGVVAQIVSTHH
jgi:uncharacterized membrane protein